jgi:hypothetical protein
MRRSKWFISSLSIAACLFVIPLLTDTSVRAFGADPDPATVPAAVDPLPPGWNAGQFDAGDIKTGQNFDLHAHFELHSEPKVGADKDAFTNWSKRAKEREAKNSAMTNRQETELKASTLSDHDIFEYEITGELFGQPLHYRVFFVPIRGVFCRMLCWTDPKHWDAANPQFEALVANLK